MKSLKVLGSREFAISHVLILIGLILFTVGAAAGQMVLIIISAWFFTFGLCALFSSAFAKLSTK